jgi:glycosyltransferase involved in cell wall biosynthesis
VHRRLEMAYMGRMLRTAAATVTTTPESARQIREAFPDLESRLVASIPNGYDSFDFEFEVEPRRDDKFVILHSGYLHTDIGMRWRGASHVRRALGGERAGADILTRSHVYILRAIDRVLERDPSLEGRLELQLAGVLSDSDRAETARSSYVRTLGYLPHLEAIRLMRSADLLFLPMQNLPPGVRSGTVPGKTYEYLAAGRPILAAVPEGDARDLLIQADTAHICQPDDVDAMADALEHEIARWRRAEPIPAVDEDLLRSFERSSLTAEFAAVLDAVSGRLAPETARALARLSA